MQTRLLTLGFAPVLCAGLCAPAAEAPRAEAPRAAEAADRARTKVVVLKTAHAQSRGAATGFLARTRLVLTVSHAVTQGGSITAWVNGVPYGAQLAATHPEYDLAVLRLRSPELLLKPVELAGSTADLAPGEPLVIVAGPAQPPGATGDPSQRVAIPAAFRRRVLLRGPGGRPVPMLALESSIEHGDSGSPVIRVKDGRVVGMVNSRELPDPGGISRTAYAVPVEALHSWLDEASRRTPDGEEFYLLKVIR